MNDFISREAAIKVLCDACGNAACPKGLIPRCSYYEKMQSIPAADVQPVKRGKDVCDSITDRHCEFKCSLCGEEMLEVWCDNEFNYCPFCGALMQDE